jgi:toxin CptA
LIATAAPGATALGVSRVLTAWIVCASLCTVILSLLYLPLAAAAAAGCLALLQAWPALQSHALRRHRDSIVALKHGSSEFSYQLQSGAWRSGTVMAGGLVTRWLTVVRIRDEDGSETPQRRVLVLCSDSLGAEDYRRLRVYLRWRWRDPAAIKG